MDNILKIAFIRKKKNESVIPLSLPCHPQDNDTDSGKY